MTERRGALTYTGAALIIAGAVVCGAALGVHNGENGDSYGYWGPMWDMLFTRQKVVLLVVLFAAVVLAITAMASRARWPRSLAAVFAGIGVGWFLVWDLNEVHGDDTGIILSIVGGLLLLGGALLSAIAASVGPSSSPAASPVAQGTPRMPVTPQASPRSQPAAPTAPQVAPSPPVSATPADWYPDPAGQARLRYWDGTAWTDHTAP